MSFCPEDGKEMKCIELTTETADYMCPECDTHWRYEEGCYRVIEPEQPMPESICDDSSIAV